MSKHTTAADAIRQSIQQHEIVHLPYDATTATDLLVECEDNTEAGDVTEYWGTTDEGDEWRVHMARSSALTLDDIDALTITATGARPSDTDAADGVDVDITLRGAVAVTGTVTLTPLASGQGMAANAPSLEQWIAAGELLDLLEAQPDRLRRELARAIEAAAADAANAMER